MIPKGHSFLLLTHIYNYLSLADRVWELSSISHMHQGFSWCIVYTVHMSGIACSSIIEDTSIPPLLHVQCMVGRLLLSSLLLANLGLIIVLQILWLVAFVATVLLGADLGLLVGVASAVVVIVGKTAL